MVVNLLILIPMIRDPWVSVLDVEGQLPGEPPATEEVSGE